MGPVRLLCLWLVAGPPVVLASPHGSIPTLEELSTQWVDAVPLRGVAPVQNFWGACGLRGAPMNGERPTDLVSLSQLLFTPYNGNLLNSSMRLNGEALLMNQTAWKACEGRRRSQPLRLPYGATGRVHNAIRLGFERRLVMSRYTFVPDPGAAAPIPAASQLERLEMELTGPLFQLCDRNLSTDNDCGWGVGLPTNRSQFTFSRPRGTSIGVVAHRSQPVAAAVGVFAVGGREGFLTPLSLQVSPDRTAFWVEGTVNLAAQDVVLMFVFGGDPSPQLTAELQALRRPAAFRAAWDGACGRFEERWRQAFTPGNPHYSGSLPVLRTTDQKLRRVYYAGALTVISLERTNLRLSPRVYTISQGNPSQLKADSSMGGAGQFVWDVVFVANTLSLLDPDSTRALVRFVVNKTIFPADGSPFIMPQLWDDFSLIASGSPTPYAFNYYAAFVFISTYVRVTNDRALLLEPINGVTVAQYLERLSTAYTRYPSIPGTDGLLTDYGGELRCFLEVVPSYIHSLTALNLGNAFMLLSAQQMRVALGMPTNPNLTATARAMINATLRRSYNGDGTFNAVYPNGSLVNVRGVVDFMYTAQALIGLGQREAGLADDWLPADMRTALSDFAFRELFVPDAGWVRSLSLEDPTYAPDHLLVMRADWGVGGSYPGAEGLTIEAFAALDGDFTRALEVLRAAEGVTRTSALAQAIAVFTPDRFLNACSAAPVYNYNNHLPAPKPAYAPAWPEYFTDGTFWPESMRDIAIVAGALPEAIIRTMFGWNPRWDSFEEGKAPADALAGASIPRPFDATLEGLRTPFGLVTLEASAKGVAVSGLPRPSRGTADIVVQEW